MTVTQSSLSNSRTVVWHRLDRFCIAALLVFTLGLYFRTRQFNFVQFDDQFYVYDNPHVLHGLSLASLHWASTTILKGNWHPLTLVVELIISTVFGPTSASFHLTNTILHGVNVVLLYLFLRLCTRRVFPSFFVAALWGLHPLRVESVAWISELKDVLCGGLWLGCMLAYYHYCQQRNWRRYSAVMLLQVLALLAKPMAVTLPAILLLLDFWPLRQNENEAATAKWWFRRIAEKVPLALAAIADISFALHTQGTSEAGRSLFPSEHSI